MSQQHREIREGDEVFCTKCHKRWGIDEDAPSCVDSKVSNNRKHINELRKVLKR